MGELGRTVDVHAHHMVRAVEELVAAHAGAVQQRTLEERRTGAESMLVTRQMVSERMPRLTRLEARLDDMDRARIDVHVVSPSPAQYHYWAEAELAVRICTTANDGIAALVAGRPDRLVGLGLVPLQHPSLMVELLDHALDRGLRGVEISSFAPGPDGARTVELSDVRLDPFWAHAAERGALVFMHPLGCSLDGRLDRFYLANVVGQPVESAVALSHLILSGVLDRHPTLRFLASHGGGYLPTFMGRSDHGWHVRPDVRGCAHVPSSYLTRLYYDSLVHSPESLRLLVGLVGAERVMLGSDHPFDMGVDDPLDRLLAAGLPDDDVQAIVSGNAHRLGLVPRATAATSPEGNQP